MHPLSTDSPAEQSIQPPIRRFGEHHPQSFQPPEHFRCLGNQGTDKLRLVLEVTAANRVQIMHAGRVLLYLGGRLNATFRHHGVGIAMAQFGGHYNPGAVLLSKQGRGRPSAAATYYQDIGFHVHTGKVNPVWIYPAPCLK